MKTLIRTLCLTTATCVLATGMSMAAPAKKDKMGAPAGGAMGSTNGAMGAKGAPKGHKGKGHKGKGHKGAKAGMKKGGGKMGGGKMGGDKMGGGAPGAPK